MRMTPTSSVGRWSWLGFIPTPKKKNGYFFGAWKLKELDIRNKLKMMGFAKDMSYQKWVSRLFLLNFKGAMGSWCPWCPSGQERLVNWSRQVILYAFWVVEGGWVGGASYHIIIYLTSPKWMNFKLEKKSLSKKTAALKITLRFRWVENCKVTLGWPRSMWYRRAIFFMDPFEWKQESFWKKPPK